MTIARGGILIVAALIALHLLLLVLSWLAGRFQVWAPLYYGGLGLALIFALLSVFSLYFFRDPDRTTPPGDRLVISPADGRVIAVEVVEEPEYMQGKAIRISIFMDLFSVHVNRYPVSGTVEFKAYRPGRFFNASLDKASRYNEALSLGVRTPEGAPVLFRQIAGLIARRIICYAGKGDRAVRGARYGLIRFGSRLEVYLPPGTPVRVATGQKVLAGESVIAEMP